MTGRSPRHQDMLDRFFAMHGNGCASWRLHSQVLWEGDNYVLIRTGIGHHKSRYTYLVDKVGLLVDEESPPLQILAAGWHPVHAERLENAEILHDSCQDEDYDKGKFSGRWCKARLSECIAYAKVRDQSYEQDLPVWIEEHETRLQREKAVERAERNFRARAIRIARKIGRVKSHYADRYRIYFPFIGGDGEACEDHLMFDVGDQQVDVVSCHISCLTHSQFRRLASLIKSFCNKTFEAAAEGDE